MIIRHDRLEPGKKQFVKILDRMTRLHLQLQAIYAIREGNDHIDEQNVYKVFVKDGDLPL